MRNHVSWWGYIQCGLSIGRKFRHSHDSVTKQGACLCSLVRKHVLYCYTKQTFNFFGIIYTIFQLQVLVLSHVIKLFSTFKNCMENRNIIISNHA